MTAASSGDISATASLCAGDSNVAEPQSFLNHVLQTVTEKHSTTKIQKAKHFNYVANFGEIAAHQLFSRDLK